MELETLLCCLALPRYKKKYKSTTVWFIFFRNESRQRLFLRGGVGQCILHDHQCAGILRNTRGEG